jgi:hypothetical protein
MTMVNQDEEHLRLLSILYYVWGGLTALGACFTGVYALVGGGLLTAVSQTEQDGPPAWVGPMVFVIMGAVFVLIAVMAWLTIWTGRNLARRQRYTFCMVVAVITCLSFPLGTALGVFTLVVLSRPSVKQLFGQGTPAAA